MSPYDTRYGYCKCGCGQKTKIAPYNHIKHGWISGEPIFYIVGHSRRSKLSDEERFWENVDKSDGPDACWPWIGGRYPNGYGKFSMGGRDGNSHQSHVWAWFFSHGEWPKLYVLHTCDFPPCNNPSHLFQGTQLDNMADMTAKNRGHKGERHGQSKLNDKKIRNIRKLYSNGWPQRIIAEHYSVSQPTISDILTGKTWTHVT